MLCEVVSPGEPMTTLSLTVSLGTVNVGDVVSGLMVSCDISFAAEELLGPSVLVQAVFM